MHWYFWFVLTSLYKDTFINHVWWRVRPVGSIISFQWELRFIPERFKPAKRPTKIGYKLTDESLPSYKMVLIILNRTFPFPYSSVPSALSLAESTSMTLPKGLIPSSIMMKRNSWHPKAQSGNVEEGLCRIWLKCLGQRKYNRQVGKMMIYDKKCEIIAKRQSLLILSYKKYLSL